MPAKGQLWSGCLQRNVFIGWLGMGIVKLNRLWWYYLNKVLFVYTSKNCWMIFFLGTYFLQWQIYLIQVCISWLEGKQNYIMFKHAGSYFLFVLKQRWTAYLLRGCLDNLVRSAHKYSDRHTLSTKKKKITFYSYFGGYSHVTFMQIAIYWTGLR